MIKRYRAVTLVLRLLGVLLLVTTAGKVKPRALKALDKHSILHNDIREENVVLDCTGRVYLIDFGISRLDQKQKQ